MAAALSSFASELTANFAALTSAQPEDQLKAPVSAVISAAGSALGVKTVTRTEVRVEGIGGRPDIGVEADSLPVGNVELKQPGFGAVPHLFPDARSRQQWEKFRALPNLIYTDGREWALYRSGELDFGPIRFSFDPTRDAAVGPSEDDAKNVAELFAQFFSWEPMVPATAPALAAMLAPVTRLLRDEVLADAREQGVMARLANEWRQTLFPDADDEAFADGYAQTFTYALLLARLEGAAAPLSAASAAQELRADHALLSQTLLQLGQPQARAAIGMPVGILERLIGAVNGAKLKRARDPWLYFYEDFLAAYDPEQRNDRGVYFTPLEVVRCQVRLVHEYLDQRLGRSGGFGDKSVITLDPATGTGNYLLAAANAAFDDVRDLGGGIVAEVANDLATNLNGFELLVGPYAVAHLRLSRTLTDAGASIQPPGVRVFLTDTLSAPVRRGFASNAPLFQDELAREQERASRVKSSATRVTVVMGNPPYDRDTSGSGRAHRKGGMVRHDASGEQYGLIEDFRAPLSGRALAQHGLNLFNDYVYFWRWAMWKVCDQSSDPGIVSFITPSSYLAGPGFAGMRQRMREQFDEVWLIDLGGEGRGSRKEENVFENVLSPVVIAIAVRGGSASTGPALTAPAVVRYRRIRGTRQEKLAALESLESLDPANWQVAPSGWQENFLPLGQSEYAGWPALTDIFCWSARGIQFSRTWPVSESRETLEARWHELVNASPPAKRQELLRQTRDANIDRQYSSFLTADKKLDPISILPASAQPDGFRHIAFRSFDRQLCIADRRVIDMPRPHLWAVYSEAQVYFTTGSNETTLGPALVANTDPPDMNAFNNRGGLCLPLYRDREARVANFVPELLEMLELHYGFPVSGQQLGCYIFGLLGTAAFSNAFGGEMASAGVRVPITKDADVFSAVVEFGEELLWWATFGRRSTSRNQQGKRMRKVPGLGIRNDDAVSSEDLPETYAYDSESQILSVGTGTFSPVPPEVWEYEVSGHKVVQSWLSYRMRNRAGKKSSPLDQLRTNGWASSRDLLELLAVIKRLTELETRAEMLLELVQSSSLLGEADMPYPTDEMRKAAIETRNGEQTALTVE